MVVGEHLADRLDELRADADPGLEELRRAELGDRRQLRVRAERLPQR
jgi:hypothetical protein